MPDLPEDVPSQIVIRVQADLMQVHSKKLEGLDIEDCFRLSYDACASACYHALAPLTDDLLCERIPAWIFHWSVEKRWISYPPERETGRLLSLGDPWTPSTERIPDAELTSRIGMHSVDPETKAEFLQRFESRIVHWQAEWLKLQAGDHATTPLDHIVPHTALPLAGQQLDSNIWKELGDQFGSITDCERMKAFWIEDPDAPHGIDWKLLGNKNTVPRFEVLARRAGSKLDPRSADPYIAWLSRLREIDSDLISRGAIVGQFAAGTIRSVCAVSVHFCLILEARAVTAEHVSTAKRADLIVEPESQTGQLQKVTTTKPQSQVLAQPAATIKSPDGDIATLTTTREAGVQSEERELLRRTYFEHFVNSEKIMILDLCWAAKERYRDWKRWLQGEKAERPIRNGSKPDKAFRAILNSKQRPEHYRLDPRPPKWQ